MEQRKKILVAAVNWGLGHAARDIIVIKELLRHNIDVVIASDGRPFELLTKEFPQLKSIRLPGYDIIYHRKGSLTFQIIRQIPKLMSSFWQEQRWLQKIIDEEKIDLVISDNRYGLYSESIPTVLITHQTGFIIPKSLKWFETILNRLNKRQIEKFTECWIPDVNGNMNLTGLLSHNSYEPQNATFIGPLTRFSMQTTQRMYDLLILLSGPEPQRSILEKILRSQVMNLLKKESYNTYKVLLVRGIMEGSPTTVEITNQFSAVDFMLTDDLNRTMVAADIVVSRSGYTTITDIVSLGKKAIFIPTPGQTEQEYLAEYFKNKGIFYSEEQDEFNLEKALQVSKDFPGMEPLNDSNKILKQEIARLLKADMSMIKN